MFWFCLFAVLIVGWSQWELAQELLCTEQGEKMPLRCGPRDYSGIDNSTREENQQKQRASDEEKKGKEKRQLLVIGAFTVPICIFQWKEEQAH